MHGSTIPYALPMLRTIRNGNVSFKLILFFA